MRLVYPALLALLIYTAGFPVLLFGILRKNKKLVKEDQLLRTLDTGDTPGSGGEAYHIRRRYHKMYYHFKPGKWYWIVLILLRKAGIVVAGLMFRANPGFQLSLIMLVLFTAYVFQVKHQPYMSTAQRKQVILDHQEKAREGHPLHVALAARIREVINAQKQVGDTKAYKMVRLGSGTNVAREGSFGNEDARAKKARKTIEAAERKKKRTYFWDFNTVEQVLLACGIFVCLAGVMFESDRFQTEDADESESPGKAKYEWQRELIVYAVLVVVIFSFVFYGAVFMSEALGFTPNWVKKFFAKKHTTHIDKLIEMGKAGHRNDGGDSMVDMTQNPIQRLEAERKAAAKAEAEMEAAKQRVAELERAAQMSRKRLVHATTLAEQVSQRNGLGRRDKSGKKKNKKVRSKQKFGQKGVDIDQKDTGTGGGSSDRPILQRNRLSESFRAHKTDDGRTYYEHEITGEVMWNVPTGAVVVETTNKAAGSRENAKKPKQRRTSLLRTQTGSTVHTDDASGQKYKVKNGSSEWLKIGEKVVQEDGESPGLLVARAAAAEFGGRNSKKRPSFRGGRNLKKRPSFRVHKAPNGKPYYHNEDTGETTWKKPRDEDIIM